MEVPYVRTQLANMGFDELLDLHSLIVFFFIFFSMPAIGHHGQSSSGCTCRFWVGYYYTNNSVELPE